MKDEVWEGRSYTREDVESAIEKVAQIPEYNETIAENSLTHLLQMAIPPEEAVLSIYRKENATHLLEEEYNSFSNWDGELPPPNVDGWVTISPNDGEIEIRDKARELVGPQAPYCVYCIEICFNHPSLQSLQREANRVFGEIDTWFRQAYSADKALYIGYTARFPKRLLAHSVGHLSERNPPAMATALADVVGAGVVEKTADEDHALTVEEKFAENLRATAEDDDISIYQA